MIRIDWYSAVESEYHLKRSEFHHLIIDAGWARVEGLWRLDTIRSYYGMVRTIRLGHDITCIMVVLALAGWIRFVMDGGYRDHANNIISFFESYQR